MCSYLWRQNKNLLSDKQHGFRQKLNTTTYLHFAHNAAQALDDKDDYHMVSFDFSKAFDKMSDILLLYK
mgnify:CR=1 FL=1